MDDVKQYADCGKPQRRLDGLWYVKMEGGYNPPYYLVNRARGKSPYVARQIDLENSLSGFYFVDESAVQAAINSYRRHHGEQVDGGMEPVDVLESQIMRFK